MAPQAPAPARPVTPWHDIKAIMRGLERHEEATASPAALTASGQRIYTTRADLMDEVAGRRQAWQKTAWAYRDDIGELRAADQFRARAMARCRVIVGQVDEDSDDVLPVSARHEVGDDGKPTERAMAVTLPEDICAAAETALAALPWSKGYGFMGVWSVNFDTAGECWLHGELNPATARVAWTVRSILEVEVRGGDVYVTTVRGTQRKLNLGTPEKPGTDEIYRLWVPHPGKSYLADSPFRSLLSVMEEIALAGRVKRAASRSRIARNGIWMIPEGMAGLDQELVKEKGAEYARQVWLDQLTAAYNAPIVDETSPGSVAPLFMIAQKDDIEAAEKGRLTFERATNAEIQADIDNGLRRIAVSIDLPPEVLTGMGDVNHWTGWLIDNSTFRHYLEPGLRLMVDSLTVSYLYTVLRAQGFPEQDIERIRFWFDAGNLTENPNRREDAIAAFGAGALGFRPYLEALGFSIEDAPSEEELVKMLATRTGFDSVASGLILRFLAQAQGVDLPELPIRYAGQKAGAPALNPSDVIPPGAPENSPPGITAAATLPPYTFDTTLGLDLLALDRNLRDRVLVAADAAVTRAVERAGNRLRSKTSGQPALQASLRQRNPDPGAWAAMLGETETFALATRQFLLADAWTALAAKLGAWLTDAATAVATRVAVALGMDPRDRARITDAMTGRIGPALHRFQLALDAHAHAAMLGQLVPHEDGEPVEGLVPPALVRELIGQVAGYPADTQAGDGAPPTLGAGSTVTTELSNHGVLTVGYTWLYGVTPTARQFHPHHELDGAHFTSWADPKLATAPAYTWVGDHYRPGDHGGCLCDAPAVYAIPDRRTNLQTDVATVPHSMRAVLDLAAGDDAAGRTNTSAQRSRDQHAWITQARQRWLDGALS